MDFAPCCLKKKVPIYCTVVFLFLDLFKRFLPSICQGSTQLEALSLRFHFCFVHDDQEEQFYRLSSLILTIVAHLSFLGRPVKATHRPLQTHKLHKNKGYSRTEPHLRDTDHCRRRDTPQELLLLLKMQLKCFFCSEHINIKDELFTCY